MPGFPRRAKRCAITPSPNWTAPSPASAGAAGACMPGCTRRARRCGGCGRRWHWAVTALGPGAALVDRELRKANRGLSALRDVQALVETLDRLIAPQLPLDILQLLRRARRIAAARRVVAARAALPTTRS